MAFIKYSDVKLIGMIENICEKCGAVMEVVNDKIVCKCGHEVELEADKDD